jgi:hypothetical protein
MGIVLVEKPVRASSCGTGTSSGTAHCIIIGITDATYTKHFCFVWIVHKIARVAGHRIIAAYVGMTHCTIVAAFVYIGVVAILCSALMKLGIR